MQRIRAAILGVHRHAVACYSLDMAYDALGSGLLTGGGVRGARMRRHVVQGGSLKHFPDVHMTDSTTVKRVVPNFDPALEFEYSPRELLLLAERILLEDPKSATEDPTWLSVYKLRQRQRREIYCANGTPEPHFVQGMYWRTHPDGRKWKTTEDRHLTGSSFYS